MWVKDRAKYFSYRQGRRVSNSRIHVYYFEAPDGTEAENTDPCGCSFMVRVFRRSFFILFQTCHGSEVKHFRLFQKSFFLILETKSKILKSSVVELWIVCPCERRGYDDRQDSPKPGVVLAIVSAKILPNGLVEIFKLVDFSDRKVMQLRIF